MRDCPKRGKLNALVAEVDDDEGGSTRVNPLQLGTYLQDSVRSAKKKDGLISAMQVKASLTHGEQTYLAALIEIKSNVVQEAPYRMAPAELAELRKQLDGLLEARLVQPSKAPYGSPILFQNLFDKLTKAKYYTKIDLRSEYWQVRVARGDESKTTCVTSQGKIQMDREKVQAVMDWGIPSKMADLRSFFVLVNYYKRFIKGYSKIVNPLKDLLRKDQKWQWTFAWYDAFKSLKQAISSQPVLKLPQFDKPFEVQVNASDRALGGVLVQDKHPVVFESRKLKDAELPYNIHEKEIKAVIHCLEAWRHYLLGTKFTVVTDNVANMYFKTQRKRSPKQARWQEFLGEFDFEWVYRPGKHNNMADVVSRKLVEEYVAALIVVESDFLDQNWESFKTDAGYLKWTGVYANGDVALPFVEEDHDPQWAGHPWINRMVALLARRYYWPRMEEDVEAYVRTCLVCQLDKEERKKEVGSLQPLPIPEVLWQSISMDFISGFLKVNGMASVLVVVDCFSKYGIFIVAPMLTLLKQRFWTTLFNMMGTELKFSTANHPQTDGHTERVNALVEDYLRDYVSASQRRWVDLLDVAQFSYDLHKSSATANRFARSKQELLDEANDSLAKAQRRMKKYADMGRRHVEFSVGDQVLLKLTPQIWKKISSKSVHRGLIPKYNRPFEDLLDMARQQTQRALLVIRKEFEKTMLKILDHRTMGQKGRSGRQAVVCAGQACCTNGRAWQIATRSRWRRTRHSVRASSTAGGRLGRCPQARGVVRARRQLDDGA
ncbi:Transposon Ty3-I Gag-Pol polyprotein [Sesamum angolense]|uniref:Transposon Ty3-I Gag-Pol polyprotein n=1 Tax=Sesamum angolense TaxID=2727404 RepID=A0AAE1T526_9LAMI|nr:Transposon Ty3-I Gag-Pol polyprotein [Sesamum angolense]